MRKWHDRSKLQKPGRRLERMVWAGGTGTKGTGTRRTGREEQGEKNRARRTGREEQGEKNRARRTGREEQGEKNRVGERNGNERGLRNFPGNGLLPGQMILGRPVGREGGKTAHRAVFSFRLLAYWPTRPTGATWPMRSAPCNCGLAYGEPQHRLRRTGRPHGRPPSLRTAHRAVRFTACRLRGSRLRREPPSDPMRAGRWRAR